MSTKSLVISPSILSADFSRLGEDVRAVDQAGADWIHVDVMDGRFVPNITIGQPVVAALKKVARVPLDVHLMIVEPERYIDSFIDAGAEVVTATEALCRVNALPVRLARPLPVDKLMDAMRKDKKVRGGTLRFVVLNRVGEAATRDGVPAELVEKLWREFGAE